MYKASELAAFALDKARTKSGYVYGTHGTLYTRAVALAKNRQYGAKMGSDYYLGTCAKWLGKVVTDCSGLFKWFIFSKLGVRYDAKWDVSADGAIKRWHSESGPIATMPRVPGIVVHSPGHIGVYVGDGNVVEARGARYGVVITELAKRPWKSWGRLNWLEYDLPPDGAAKDAPPKASAPAESKTAPALYPTLREGSKGEPVKLLQHTLKESGADVAVDGDFGPKTMSAVKAFQASRGLAADGIAGPKTWEALTQRSS